MRNMLTNNLERTLMKLVADASSDKLLGVHIAGEDAPEMIQLAAVAVKAGITKKQWDSTMALHPTAAEELMLMREKVSATPGSAA
jgi:glutathione reductase (NADPH)